MDIYQQYLKAKEEVNQANKNLEEIQVSLYNKFNDELSQIETGIFSKEDGKYKIKIIKKESVSVDQKMAESLGFGFKKKYEYSATEFKKLTDEQLKMAIKCLTTKPSKPSFSVEEIEDDT